MEAHVVASRRDLRGPGGWLFPDAMPRARQLHRTSRNSFLGSWYHGNVASWAFITNHARALLYIAHDPEARLRDLAAALDVTERTAYGIVADLTEAGYVVKEKVGRRNRYRIQHDLPPLRHPLALPEREQRGEESGSTEATIGELLDLLAHTRQPPNRRPKGGRRGRT